MFRPLFAAVAAIALSGSLATAQPRPDPDWPCAQRKVSTLGIGSVWTGPDIAEAGPWGDDREAAQFARKLASRKTELADVDALIDEFVAKVEPAEKAKKLTRVFAGVFEVLNGERNLVIHGIVRYAQGQQRLAERIREEADKISETREGPVEDTAKVSTKEDADRENAFNWDRRIFEERRKSVSYVCEVPTILEQRLGELARKIQAKI